jgi:hypothetical protein
MITTIVTWYKKSIWPKLCQITPNLFIYLFGLDIKCYENYTIFEKSIEMLEKYKFEIFSNYKHKDW